MTWPATPLPTRIGLDVAGVDTDISSYQYMPRGQLRITRGRSDEQSQPSPTVIDGLVLNNRDGRFTPRLATGVWFGQISRGSHLSVGVTGAPTRLVLPGAKGDVISSPDSASLSITGDIEVRIDAQLEWVKGDVWYIASKWVATGSQRSWLLRGETDGYLRWYWTTDGATQLWAESTSPLMPVHGRIAVAVTHDVNNGAGGNTTRFWTAPTLDGPWTQLGQPVTQSGTTSLFDSTAPVEWGGCTGATRGDGSGSLYGWELWSGIATAGGTLVSGMDLSGEAPGAATVSDGTRTWTLQGGTSLVDVDMRAVGEIAAWPVRWDTTGIDATVEPEASGIMRRIGGTSWSSLRSPLYRSISGFEPDAYWPCEDGSGATSFASAVAGVDPMTIDGTPTIAGDETIIGSGPLPVLKDAQLTGRMPTPYPATGISTVQWIMRVDTSSVTPASGQTIMSSYHQPTTAGSTIDRWELSYRTAGGLRLLIYGGGAIIVDTGAMAFGVDNKILSVQVLLEDDGAGNLDWSVITIEVGATFGLAMTGSVAGWVPGGVRVVRVNESGGLVDVTVGHVWVRSAEATTEFVLGMSAGAWAGETAGARIVRLCTEEGVPVDMRGAPARTPLMGPQSMGTLMEALSECEAVDGGLLYEPRGAVGIAYRTLASLLDQDPVVTVSRSGHDLVAPWEPVDDDRGLANDVTVRRADGSMIRLVDSISPLGTAQPPAGVGIYSSDTTLVCYEDSQLGDLAGWALRQGTVDAARLSALAVQLAREELVAAPDTTAGVLALDIGDVIEVTGLPAQMPPDPIRVLVTGITEQLTQFTRAIQATGGPAARCDVATWQADVTFSDSFESGGLTAWPTVTGAASALAAAARTGSFGLRLTPSAGTAATVATSTVKWSQNLRWAQVALRIRLGTLPAAGSMSLVTIQTTAGAGHLDFFVHSSGRFWADLVGGSSDLDTGIVAATGQWYDVQLKVFYGDTTWWAWVQIDGVEYGPLTQTAVTPSYVRSLHLGTSSTTTAWSADVDSVTITVGDIRPEAWEQVRSRWDTDASELTAGITAAATTMQVTTTTGPVWTWDEAMLPFDLAVGGERVRVEGVTGTTSPQTMTVVRAVNGVSKAHAAGTAVSLWKPGYYAVI